MTKKDFVLIASVINGIGFAAESDRLALAQEFARRLGNTNPQFDSKRFVRACLAQS